MARCSLNGGFHAFKAQPPDQGVGIKQQLHPSLGRFGGLANGFHQLFAASVSSPYMASMKPSGHSSKSSETQSFPRIAPGLRADLAIWDARHPAELSYRIGATQLHARIYGGRFDA